MTNFVNQGPGNQFNAAVQNFVLPDGSDLAELLVGKMAARFTANARSAGVTDAQILTLARRVTADVQDVTIAFAEIERAVTIAIEMQTRGHTGSNTGQFVDTVLARMAKLSASGDDTAAALEADRAFAEWQARESERQSLETQKGIALLEAGLRADILRRAAPSAARRIADRVALETPDPAKRFKLFRVEQEKWYIRGRDQGLNFDLEISVHLANDALAAAGNPDERGTALNDLCVSLATLGERESGTARLEEAVIAYHAALHERTRDRVPLAWAMTQNNLGNILRTLGERESGTSRLKEAVIAFCSALEERTRDRAPLDWAMTQNNLGNALRTLGERENDTARLKQSVLACRAALKENTRFRVPLDWASTQNNLGNALSALGGRESGTARLEKAVVAYRAALQEWTRDRVSFDWARAQVNLGTALAILGRRESGTAQLEEAVTAYQDALEEMTRDRVPLDWAGATGNLAVALLILAERKSDIAMARQALEQFTTAEQVLREGSNVSWAETLAQQIPAAKALVIRLTGS